MANKNNSMNKMATMPEGRLLFEMAVPLMISMLIQAMYNIVDSIYVGMLGEHALTAVTLGSPASFLMISVFVGTGVGVSSFLSRKLGEDDLATAKNVASHALVLALINVIPFMLFGFFGAQKFISMYSDDPEIVKMGVAYLKIVSIFCFGQSIGVMLSRMMQSFGDSMFQMTTQGVGAILNIIMDPIFIFGRYGMPRLGVSGAAYATVLSQIISMVFGLVLVQIKKKPVPVTIKGFSPDAKIFKGIYQVGLPSIIMQSIGSVLTVCLNGILISLSTTAVAVSGVYGKLQSFVFMPVFGISNALVAIVGYNYGARNRKRMMKTFKIACISAVSIMFCGLLVFEFMPEKLLALFSADENMLSIGVPALRIIAINFCFAAVGITIGSIFSGTGDGVHSMIISFVRQIVVILPVAYLLSKTGNVNNVWWAYVIAEGFGLGLSLIFFRKTYKNKILPLDESAD